MMDETPIRKRIYYCIYRGFYKISPRNVSNNIRWKWQRMQRGWSDRDAWNVDYHLAEVIPPMLRKLVEMGNSFPIPPKDDELTEKEWETHYKKWHKALLKAADDIEQHKVATDYAEKHKDMQKAVKRVERGLDFVKKNFFQLWD